MPMTQSTARLRRAIGWFVPTPVEITVALIVVALIWFGAVPHFQRWQFAQRVEDEQETIMRVRAALMGALSANRPCVGALDDCPDGSTADECAFFSGVLEDPVTSTEWKKVLGAYRGPAGGYYRYIPEECQIRQVAEPVDTR
jgi:hypothetical protein